MPATSPRILIRVALQCFKFFHLTSMTASAIAALFSFRMISDTQIECRDANSQGEAAWFGPAGRNWGGTEPRSSGAVGLDGFLSSLRQRGPHLPPLRHQSPDVLSLAAPL